MCGIGGFVAAHRSDQVASTLDETRIRLRHRGPDGEGQWLSEDRTAGLCHTRLAIVDLSPPEPSRCYPQTALCVEFQW